MKTFKIIDLDINEANMILSILGDIPTKSGVYPLFVKIRMQLEAQNAEQEKNEVIENNKTLN